MTVREDLRKLSLLLGMAVITVSLNAQPTLTDVINAFNSGAEEVNAGNFESAIGKFEETIALAEELGEEGNEMKTSAMQQIPALHYRMATDSYKAKDISGAITGFEKTVESCDRYGNDAIKEKALKYIPQLYNAQGKAELKAEDYQAALASFAKAFEYKPDYAQAVYYQGLAYSKLEDDENMISCMDKAMDIGTSSGDEKTAAAAAKTLKTHFVNAGKLAYKDKDYEAAIGFFESSYKYDAEDPDPYYITCVIYGEQGEFEKAVEYGLKAVQYEKAEDQAKIWYEIGNAYMNLVEYDKACDAFSKALVEPYLKTVQHKMENVLNCQ